MPGTEQGSVKAADLTILNIVRHWLRDRDAAKPLHSPARSLLRRGQEVKVPALDSRASSDCQGAFSLACCLVSQNIPHHMCLYVDLAHYLGGLCFIPID